MQISNNANSPSIICKSTTETFIYTVFQKVFGEIMLLSYVCAII